MAASEPNVRGLSVECGPPHGVPNGRSGIDDQDRVAGGVVLVDDMGRGKRCQGVAPRQTLNIAQVRRADALVVAICVELPFMVPLQYVVRALAGIISCRGCSDY